MQKGSMLILAIFATLILSIILVAGLSVSTTEVHTTQNYYMNKMSFYKAMEGLEIVTQEIRQEADPSGIVVAADEYDEEIGGIVRKFITGSLVDVQNHTTQNVRPFTGFDPPPLPSMMLGMSSGIQPVIWYVPIAAEVQMGTNGSKRAYTEIEAGIYSILMTGY
jgi:hypothetical protein